MGNPLGWSKHGIGYLIAAACLIWVFHDVNWGELCHHLTAINWGWVALALVADVLSYISQGIRWKLLLRPTGKISNARSTQAIYVGLFTNEVLPFRVGEVARGYVVSRWLKTDFVRILPSIVVERLFDAFWLALAIAGAAIFVQLPKTLMRAADILGIFVLLAIGLLVFLVFRKKRIKSETASGWKPIRLISTFISHLTDGVQEIGFSPLFFLALLVSSGFLIFQALAFWLIMVAYGLKLSLLKGFVVLLIVFLGIALPNAPSSIGTYQFFTVLGLGLFGVEKTVATGFSVIVFIILTAPMWALGLLALKQSGMSLNGIRANINKIRSH